MVSFPCTLYLVIIIKIVLVFAKISAHDNKGRPNFQVTLRKLPYFCESFSSWYRAVQIFKWLYKICLILAKVSALDNRGSASFWSDFIKSVILLRKLKLMMIIGAVQIFKWHHHNCLIFEKVSGGDHRNRLNFQAKSTKTAIFLRKFLFVEIRAVLIFKWLHLRYFCKKFSLW